MKSKIKIGERYNKLTVIKNIGTKNNRLYFLCKCDCGNEIEIMSFHLLSGQKSCGCVSKKMIKNLNRTHGRTGTPEYRTWLCMKQRCLNKNEKKFYNYGGRGIEICDEWKNSFEAFLRDMGHRPKGKTLDRIDNDGNYCKENCRWATAREQSSNQRTNHYLIYNNEIKTLSQWSRDIGISYQSILKRIKNGWSIEKALTIPKAYRHNNKYLPRISVR